MQQGNKILMRHASAFAKSLAVAAHFVLAYVGSAQVVSMNQTPVLDNTRMGEPGYYTVRDATVNSITPEVLGPRIDVSFNLFKARLGQTIPTPANWTGTNMLSCRIQNTESYPVALAFMISTTVGNDNDFTNGYYCVVDLPANSNQRYCFFFSEPAPPNAGIRVLPKPFDGDFIRYNGSNNTALNRIWHWRFSCHTPAGARIIFSEFTRVQYSLNLTGMVDQFFQYDGRDWDSKVYSIQDLLNATATENADLNENPPRPDLLGSTTLPSLAPSSRWRVNKLNGKWFLVHPNGRMFWSLGMNAVSDLTSTAVLGREYLFQDPPALLGPNGDLFALTETSTGQSIQAYQVTRHNMRLKYPGITNFRQTFMEITNRRLDSWGVNTAGAFSVIEAYTDQSRPFVVLLRTTEFPNHIPVISQTWGPPVDPFDPAFQSWCNTNFATKLAPLNGKTNFMGVYVDNELSWGFAGGSNGVLDRWALPIGILKAQASQPAKQEFIKALTRKYRTISRLNQAWRTGFSSWSSLNSPVNITLASQVNYNMERDFKDFLSRFAAAYFTKVKAALDYAGCTGLYMGCRFWQQTPEVVTAASQVCDVLSFNNYSRPENYDWEFYNSLRKPVIISEWSVEVDQGPTLGRWAMSREQRGQIVRNMLQAAMSQPNIVGLHWFELYDMPATNRAYNDENYGIGALSVTDIPHQEIIDAFRWATSNLYSWRN